MDLEMGSRRRRPIILVVGEDRELASDIRALVEPAVRVESARNTMEGAAALMRSVPDLLLLDLDLTPFFSPTGALEGVSFLKVVRDHAGYALPVVVMSNDPNEELRAHLAPFRPAAVVPKPPDVAAVIAILTEKRGD